MLLDLNGNILKRGLVGSLHIIQLFSHKWTPSSITKEKENLNFYKRMYAIHLKKTELN